MGDGTLRLKKREGEMVVWCGTRGQPTEWLRHKWILPSASTVLSNLSIFNYILKKRENIKKRKRGKYITCDCFSFYIYIYIYIYIDCGIKLIWSGIYGGDSGGN